MLERKIVKKRSHRPVAYGSLEGTQVVSLMAAMVAATAVLMVRCRRIQCTRCTTEAVTVHDDSIQRREEAKARSKAEAKSLHATCEIRDAASRQCE